MLYWIGQIFLWLGYLILGLLVLIILLSLIPIRIEVKVDRQQKWAEARYTFFKYRIDLDEILNKDGTEEDEEISERSETAFSEESVAELVEEKETKEYRHMTGSKTESPKFLEPEPVKAAESGFHGFEAPPIPAAPESPRIPKALKFRKAFALHDKMSPTYWIEQYRIFKSMYHRAVKVLDRVLAKITFKHLESVLYFSVEEPFLNARLMGGIWAAEANIHRLVRHYFRKVERHRFEIKSPFKGYETFLEVSFLLSFSLAGIFVAALTSIKDLWALKKQWDARKNEGNEPEKA
jgi:hypothetical protein